MNNNLDLIFFQLQLAKLTSKQAKGSTFRPSDPWIGARFLRFDRLLKLLNSELNIFPGLRGYVECIPRGFNLKCAKLGRQSKVKIEKCKGARLFIFSIYYPEY